MLEALALDVNFACAARPGRLFDVSSFPARNTRVRSTGRLKHSGNECDTRKFAGPHGKIDVADTCTSSKTPDPGNGNWFKTLDIAASALAWQE